MSDRSKTILFALGLILLIGIAYSAYNLLSKDYAPQTPSFTPGEIARTSETAEVERFAVPDFTMTDADGNAVKLSDFFGKPIVLNFWASWCPPCKGEMPQFNTVYEDTKDDIQFIMLDMVDGQRETVGSGLAHVTDQGYTFPVYYDSGQNGAIACGISSLPTTLFIDAEGYILGGYQYAIDEDTLREAIALILGDKK